ncbi:MAG: hypothetical protein Q3M24_03190 [Candidatus Electrothrix aestuarii]|uniref:Uncharacterized protein n=1 Tax=Candidatus Electrothrix aestuarii TaxID=3062594 RepID=A0AAU8LX29_9BACT|nr:hypothetical protein [Candidatus Electrothrix aestuarii]
MKIRKVLEGQFYGLTKFKNKWFVFHKNNDNGEILSFSLKEDRIISVQKKVMGLSPGCHQIDFCSDKLHVIDTYNNCIQVYASKEEKIIKIEEFYPFGSLENGRNSENYVHMNSIWKKDDFFYLFLHNETMKTGKKSEIAILNDKYKVVKRHSTEAVNGHNILKFKGDFVYCNSNENSLVADNKSVFQADLFTRGLALSSKYILVGGSQYGERSLRKNLSGKVYVLNHNFGLLHVLNIPGMVQEIRIVEPMDHCLSNSMSLH